MRCTIASTSMAPGDVVDRDLLDDAHEVDLGDHVLGDLLHDHRDQRGGLRLVAGLLATRDLVPVPQRVLDRAERALHDRGPGDRTAHARGAIGDRVDDRCGPPLRLDGDPEHRAGDQRQHTGFGVGVGVRVGHPGEDRAGGPSGEPERPEPEPGAAAQHVGDPGRRGGHRLGARHHARPRCSCSVGVPRCHSVPLVGPRL